MPVPVVFFSKPVPKPESKVLLIPFTVVASDPAVLVTSPVKAGTADVLRVVLRLAADPVVF